MRYCDKCLSFGKCLTCKKGTNLRLNGVCYKKCMKGSFSLDGVCTKCVDGCLACTGIDKCTKWDPKKVKTCNPFTYLDKAINECKSCPANCEKCNGKKCLKCSENSNLLKNGKCLECPIRTYFKNNKCNKCTNSCETCLNSQKCETCKKGLSITKSGKCFFKCPSGQFSLEGVCTQCKEGCLKCKDGKSC